MSFSRPWIAIVLLTMPAVATANDWPQFRGPGGLGVAAKEKGLPVKWDDDTNVAWKAALPGPGSSSPIVVGERVLVTCYSGYGLPKAKAGELKNLRRHLLCYDRAGKLLWKKDVAAQAKESPYSGPYITLHGYASSTPASDGKYVCVFFGTAGVICYDLDGHEKWHVSVGAGTNGWGSGSSPVLYKDLIIVNACHEAGALVALNKNSGELAWTAEGIEMSWSTPTLVDTGKRAELVVNLPGRFRAYDPETGGQLWSCKGTTDYYVVNEVTAHDGIVYANGGRDNMACAVKAGGKGEVADLWRIAKGSNVSSPLYHDGRLYYAHEGNGVVYCIDAADGKLVYDKRLTPQAGRIYASATCGDGKIYYVSRENGVYVLEASPTFKLLAHNRFKGDASVFNASPAIADGQIYLRSDRFLYCIGKKN
jgi:outer membrane protein assembly factor BamB